MSGNPYPEDFTKGNYAFYKPEGKISIAHNEKEIVDKYNEIEGQGYNIDINPRYGWKRNQENKLEIDPEKMSAQEMIKAQSNIRKAIEARKLEEEAKYFQEFKTHSPTVQALVNEGQKIARQNLIEQQNPVNDPSISQQKTLAPKPPRKDFLGLKDQGIIKLGSNNKSLGDIAHDIGSKLKKFNFQISNSTQKTSTTKGNLEQSKGLNR